MKRFGFLILMCIVFATALNAAVPVKKVRLGYLRNDLHHLAAWVALEQGFFRDEGLSVEIEGIFNAGPEMMSAFASKSIDVGYLGMAPSITGVANKAASVKAVSLANAEGSAIVVRKDAPLQSVKDLAGKIIAIPGYSSVQDFLLRKTLESAGIDPKSTTILVIKPPEMLSALSTRQIDAFIAWEPHPSKAVTMGIGRVLISSPAIWNGHPCCVVAVEERFHKESAQMVSAFLAAHLRAIGYIRKNPEEAIRIGMKYTGMDAETIRMAFSNITYHYAIKEKDVKEYLSYLLKFGYIKNLSIESVAGDYLELKTLRSIVKE